MSIVLLQLPQKLANLYPILTFSVILILSSLLMLLSLMSFYSPVISTFILTILMILRLNNFSLHLMQLISLSKSPFLLITIFTLWILSLLLPPRLYLLLLITRLFLHLIIFLFSLRWLFHHHISPKPFKGFDFNGDQAERWLLAFRTSVRLFEWLELV